MINSPPSRADALVMKPSTACSRAFSLVELVVVILVIGILAGLVVARYSGLSDDAKASAVQSTLSGVRAGIAGYRTNQILAGGSPYPSLVQLTTVGTVLQDEIPVNPYNNQSAVQSVNAAAAAARTVSNNTTIGWNYYADNASNPPASLFYANDSTTTTVPDGSGGYKTANEL